MLKKITAVLLLSLFYVAASAQQTYRLDNKKSKILWDAQKAMGGHHGYLLFNSGNLIYAPNGEPESGFFNLNMNSMRSTDHALAAANEKVDNELKSDRFFNMAKYPEATIKIRKIIQEGRSVNYKVVGELTIKGVTNSIDFTATIQKNGDVINATAKTIINRDKWHIASQPGPQSWDLIVAVKDKMIANEIGISLNLVFVK